MVSKQFSDLVTRVLYYLGHQDEAADAPIRIVVKQALNDANQERCLAYPWPFLLSVVNIPIVAGQRNYALPADFARLKQVRNTTDDVTLREVPRGYELDLGLDVTAGEGRTYQVENQTLVLMWTPATGGDNLQVSYYRLPGEMVADASTPDIPAPFQNIIVYDALLLLTPYTTEATNAQVWIQQQQKLEQAMAQAFLVDGQAQGAHGSYIHYTDDDEEYAD